MLIIGLSHNPLDQNVHVLTRQLRIQPVGFVQNQQLRCLGCANFREHFEYMNRLLVSMFRRAIDNVQN